MLLKKFSCVFGPLFSDQKEDDMIFEDIVFQNLNLIVGKNASGKSMLVQFINFLSKNRSLTNAFNWTFTYEDRNDIIEYKVKVPTTGLIEETLLYNGSSYLERLGDKATIHSDISNTVEVISPPANEFVIYTRRDAKAYPYIEKLVKWNEGIHFFRFGHIHPNSFLGHNREDGSLTSIQEFNKVIGNLSSKDFDQITINANKIGFKLDGLYSIEQGDKNVLYMREHGVIPPISQYYFSQGMFRAISLLIFIHYLTEKVGAGVIIVDDLCEGMDYERASKLGKLIYETLESKNIQFIATSNDSFLMNVVDVKYWNILHREANHINSYNITNSKEKFDKFKKSGLNNFDLFSSDFLD
jgi:energy-coupling factor transporter ATP-binding protein EcfA2